jgi:hypothetical protein
LTGSLAVSYAQRQQKVCFFSKVKTVLPVLGLVGGHPVTFTGSVEAFAVREAARRPHKWEDSHIIPMKINKT